MLENSTDLKHKILFVCMGNICRSPSAEGVFRDMVKEHNLSQFFYIDSCGTHGYHTGQSPDSRSQHAAMRRGIDISQQTARTMISIGLTTYWLWTTTIGVFYSLWQMRYI